MDYDFGDVIDAREVAGIDHFIVIIGEINKKDKITKKESIEVMYYKINSHVYAVFKTIAAYFSDCLRRKDKHFLKFYSKEKGNDAINLYGPLCQAVFLDRETNYSTCLDTESMIVINCDPKIFDKNAFEALRMDKKILYRDKLKRIDAFNLINTIKHSDEVSPYRMIMVATCFNRVKSTFK